MAVTLTSSSMPSRVPCAIASTLECGGSSMTMSAAGSASPGSGAGSGTISSASISPAGTLMTEATIR